MRFLLFLFAVVVGKLLTHIASVPEYLSFPLMMGAAIFIVNPTGEKRTFSARNVAIVVAGGVLLGIGIKYLGW